MIDAKTLHWIFSVPIGVTICAFGLLGNLISIWVWTRILRKSYGGNRSTGIYLLALGIVDSGLLIFFIFDDALPSDNPILNSTYSFCVFHSYIGFPFFFFFIVSSIWLVVGVTLNRFLMVMFPLKAKKICSATRAYIGIGATLFCCFVINVPHFFNFRPAEVNGTYSIAPTEYSKQGSAAKYEFWVHCMFIVLAPWAIIAFCNGGIIYSLVKRAQTVSKKFHKMKGESHSHERQMTVMLLVITFSFLILMAWQCITQCFFMLGFGKGSETWDIVNKSFAAAKLGVVINSSINFLLYCCSGVAFRKELMGLFVEQSKSFTFSSSFRSGTRVTNDSSSRDSRYAKDSTYSESRA